MSDYSLSCLNDFRSKFVDELIVYAMQIAIDKNKKTLSYVGGILNNFEKEEITSVLEAKQQIGLKPSKSGFKNYEQREYDKSKLDKLYVKEGDTINDK